MDILRPYSSGIIDMGNHMGGMVMDKLDIFELDPETKVQTTISELRKLYSIGWIDGSHDDMEDSEILVDGDIV